MTRIRVVVTAEDIAAAGEPLSTIDASKCPLARALRRRGFRAEVFYTCWRNGDERYPLNIRARQFSRDYGRVPLSPSVFYLEGPDR